MFFSNKVFTVLLLAAIAVWGVVIVRVVQALRSTTADQSGQTRDFQGSSLDLSALNWKKVVLDTTLRDPFQSYLYSKKQRAAARTKVTKPRKKVKAKPEKTVSPPKAKLNGVLGGANPTAILKQGGKTELVKKGSSVWGFTVVSIAKNKVVVKKEGRLFTISR